MRREFVRWPCSAVSACRRSAGQPSGSTPSHSARRPSRPRRPRQLLDADLHQLAAPGGLGPRPVAGLRRRRPDRDRSPHAGVFFRARARPRAAGDERASDRLPGRRRQRLRDLERLRQPLLAGALLRRHGRRHPPTTTSAKDATRNRSASYSGCSASSASPSRSKGSAWRRRPSGTTCARPRRISAPAAANTSRHRTAPRSTNAARALTRPTRTDSVPRAPRRRGSGPVTRRGRRRGRERPASGGPPLPARAPARRVRERTLEIAFLEPGAQAYAFTFG
jgi:hypothetical protein